VPNSVRAAFQHLADVAPELFERAIRKGLKAKPPPSFPYVQLAAFYLDGKPVERVTPQGTMRLLFLPVGALVDQGGTPAPALPAGRRRRPMKSRPANRLRDSHGERGATGLAQ